MHLVGTEITTSPANPGFLRLSVEIKLESHDEPLLYWFDVPSEYREYISESGNPWLVLMLPIACYLGEPIHISKPVDQLLMDNLRGLQRVWTSWYPDLHFVDIHASEITSPANNKSGTNPKKTAAFFSSGIDSFFTLFRHTDRPLGDGKSTIDDLICVGGFNMPLEDFDHMRASLRRIAEHFGKTLVPVSMNLRSIEGDVVTPYSDGYRFADLAHGAALAATGHIFANRYKELLIASSQVSGPCGSHPLTDRLLGSRELRVVHEGASFNRVEKTALVAESDLALEALHVCWQAHRHGNCSDCPKCLLTMATLDLLGATEKAKTFDWSGYSIKKLGKVWLNDEMKLGYFSLVAKEAEKRGRTDILKAASKSINYSRRKQKILSLINSNPVSRTCWQEIRKLRNLIRRLRA